MTETRRESVAEQGVTGSRPREPAGLSRNQILTADYADNADKRIWRGALFVCSPFPNP
jgi:hypothetical protein